MAMDILVILSVTLALFSSKAENCSDEQQCSHCSSSTGYCTTDCFQGYYGLKCKSTCSKTCKNSRCSQTQNGIHKCSDGCVAGFYGTRCDNPCISPKGKCTICPQGCDGQFCDHTSSCVSGCHDSYYGSNCKNCSRRCRYCNRITGKCDECHEPYLGQDCQFSCEHCSTTNCLQTCAPGLYGRTCSKRCSNNCVTYSAANTNNTVTGNSSTSCISECERQSGECISGCVDGWSGAICSHIQWKNNTSTPESIQCNSNCVGCNETGACVEGCLPGHYGDDCKPCSGTCFNHTCHPNNGTCDNGCSQGQYGQFCKLSCTNCPAGICHLRTGICEEETKGGTLNVLAIGLSTTCVLLVGIVCILVFHLWRSRKSSSRERDYEGDESTHTGRSRQAATEYYALYRYWDIEDYDEVSQPQDQQQGPAGEGIDSDTPLPVLTDYLTGTLDTEDNTSDPVLPVLADY